MRKAGLLAAALLSLALFFPSGAAWGASCRPVENPYEGTQYEGVNLDRIRTEDVGCRKARQVARGAHRKGLAMAPPPSGILSYRWHAWSVIGDLRPAHDQYVARRDGKRVRWVF